ncbi:solute carrier family 7 member 13-like [Meriones unguiculatus]|uniref:solute carrier family 7 member 13-like n=1 Tax=Meriones unguiculatus TaxID=10047 RepID=UPI00293EB415|nr:solute carrier family 7 member 13-like [Meriones unguiculatus]
MKLLRTTGFFHGSALLFSAMVGAGIFVSPKGALKYSSLNIPVSLSIWVGCALLSMMNALCLAELGTTFPVSGASYYFLKRSLGYSVAFLSLWIKTFTHFLGTGAQSLLIASYLIQPFYSGCPAPEVPKKCLALAVLWFFGILNARGMKTVARFQTVTSLMKIFILCLISLTGVVLLVIGKKENVSRFENALDAELPDTSQIAEAILQVYFSYIGSSLLINIVGKVIHKNICHYALWVSLKFGEKINMIASCFVWRPFVFGSIVSSVRLIFTPVIRSPSVERVYQVAFLGCGLLCYWLPAHLHRHAACFDTITCHCQLLFNVSPSEDQDKLIAPQNYD